MNTPQARVLNEGELLFQFNNYEDKETVPRIYRQKNYTVAFSPLPRIEISARAAEGANYTSAARDTTHQIMDLGASVGVLVLREGHFLPSFLVGAADIGGGSNYFHTEYVVAGKTFFDVLSFHAGYGFGLSAVSDKLRAKRMTGAFGSAMLNIRDAIHLLAEYDTEGTNLGVTAFPFSLFWGKIHRYTNVDLAFHFGSTNLDRIQGAIALTIPLTKRSPLIEHLEKEERTVSAGTPLETSLKDDGFENIEIRQPAKGTVSVAFENRRYLKDNWDGIHAVIKRVDEANLNVEKFNLIEKKRNIELYRFSLSSNRLKELAAVESISDGNIRDGEAAFEPESYEGSLWNPMFSKSDIILVPKFFRQIATNDAYEEGVGHVIQLSARLWPVLVTQLWTGAVLNVAGEFPCYNMRNFKSYGYDPRLQRLLWQQLIPVSGIGIAQFSVGRMSRGKEGVALETFWPLMEGPRFGLFTETGFYSEKMLYLPMSRFAIGGLSWNLPYRDLRLKVLGGIFLDQDRGGGFDFTRFFGPVELGLFLRATDRAWAVGSLVRIPLTIKREPLKPWYVRVRLPEQYQLKDQSTFFVQGSSGNIIMWNVGNTFQTDQNLIDNVLDRQRVP